MARPSPTILQIQEVGDSTWEILGAEVYYVITYKNQPASIRVVRPTLTGTNFIYKKMTYTNLGSAKLQVKTLNHRFKCQDFDVMQVS